MRDQLSGKYEGMNSGYRTTRQLSEKVQTCKKQSMFTQLTEIDMNFHNVYSHSY